MDPARPVRMVSPFDAGGGSDLMAVVSVQGCHSRSVRDTAAFVDACRGAAPGEFMPFRTPAETCTDLIAREDAVLAPGGGRALVPTGIAIANPYINPRNHSPASINPLPTSDLKVCYMLLIFF